MGCAIQSRLRDEQTTVLAIGQAELDLASPAAEQTLSDILRPSDAIIILAAAQLGRKLDKTAFSTNRSIVVAACSAIRRLGCEQLTYVSSDAVYPYSTTPIAETVEPKPDSLYGEMHLAREALLETAKVAATATLRISQVFGPNDPHRAYGPGQMLTSAINRKRMVIYGNGEEFGITYISMMSPT